MIKMSILQQQGIKLGLLQLQEVKLGMLQQHGIKLCTWQRQEIKLGILQQKRIKLSILQQQGIKLGTSYSLLYTGVNFLIKQATKFHLLNAHKNLVCSADVSDVVPLKTKSKEILFALFDWLTFFQFLYRKCQTVLMAKEAKDHPLRAKVNVWGKTCKKLQQMYGSCSVSQITAN